MMEDIKYKTLDALSDLDEVERLWRQVLVTGEASFFLSWEWLSTWLETLPRNEKVDLVVGYIGQEPVLAYFLGRRNIKRKGIFHYRLASLNSTGSEYLDELTIEYNGVLVSCQLQIDIIQEISSNDVDDWDELCLPGLADNLCLEVDLLKEAGELDFIVEIERESNSYYVELEKVRVAEMNYAGLLSSNKRQQIRRSIREYSKTGEIQTRVAKTSGEALKMLDALAELHQREWIQRGREGSFANKYFYEFHKTLIKKHFNRGIVQLIHICSDQDTIGYLYNFIHGNNVLFYQCGFNYMESNHARPGLISHYFAVLMNAERGYGIYDFLAGDSQYKKSLATNSRRMLWVILKKKNLRSWVEKNARRIYKKMKEIR
jgi:CelD/BcsL family acetyltransferase involved in cellulose biosynthesis